MSTAAYRIRTIFAVIGLGLALSACGYNTIPTLEEQAKARWSDVQNQYQRRADLIPNLVATVQGYAKQEKDVLTAVIEARAKATQVKLDASQLTDPDKLKQFQDAQNQLTGALGRLLAVTRELSRPEIERELPRTAVAARRHRKPYRRGAARLHRCGARLQHRAADDADGAVGEDVLLRQQADGRIHRHRRRREATAGEVLTATLPSSSAKARSDIRRLASACCSERRLLDAVRGLQLARPGYGGAGLRLCRSASRAGLRRPRLSRRSPAASSIRPTSFRRASKSALETKLQGRSKTNPASSSLSPR